MLQKIKAVIFDFDGTLLDVREAGIKALVQLFQKYDLNMNEKNARAIRDWRLDDIVANLNNSLLEKSGGQPVGKHEIRDFLNQIEYCLFSDTLPVLYKLKIENVLLLLVSNRTNQDLVQKMQKYGLNENLFFYVKGVEGTLLEKPHPDSIAEAINLLRRQKIIIPDQVISVGDHLVDMQVAQAWNIQFFALTCGVTNKQSFLNAGLPECRIFNSLAELFSK